MSAASAPVAPWNGQSDQDKDCVARVSGCVISFENGIGQGFKERCDHLFSQYRGFRQLKDIWVSVDEPDRDVVLNDARSDWGSQLHIPYAFSTIETMVPQAIAQRPRMLVIPRREEWKENAENLRELIDRQQDAVDCELTWQEIMRSGFIYGLGVGKSFWRREWTHERTVQPRMFGSRFGGSGFYVTPRQQKEVFNDPDLEDVDIYDFMWDAYGHSLRSCAWMVHRLWMSTPEVLYRLESGAWNTDGARALQESDMLVKEGRLSLLGGDGTKYDDVFRQRLAMSGMDISNEMTGGERPHEVWEWHDGNEVITILDRSVCVQRAESALGGKMPFHLYRPTPLQKQLVGIGEIEPIDSLSRELDTYRSMMLDAGVIAMCAGYAYDDQAIDEDDLVFGPASAIRVSNANPADALMPLPTKDLPRSAYENSRAIMADIERVTGINDALAGGDGGSISTATEAQLVQASLSKRVNLKSRRFEIEVCRSAARVWVALNQRMTLEEREIALPVDPRTPGQDPNVGVWKYVTLGPMELAGEFEVMAEGGTLAAENVPQMRADAQALGEFTGDGDINQRALKLDRLRLMGVKRPHQLLVPEEMPIPPVFREILVRAGKMTPQEIDALLTDAMHMAQGAIPNRGAPEAAAGGGMVDG